MDTSFPNLSTTNMQDTSNLSNFFDETQALPAPSMGNGSWGMSMFNFGELAEFPFPTAQNDDPHLNMAPQAINPQIINPYMTDTNNGLLALQVHNNEQQGLAGQQALPAMFDTSNTHHINRQAVAAQEPPRNSTVKTEEAAEAAPKKTRKGRKKRSKQLSKDEEEQKRQKFLDRNKVAAHKCRQRKKEWVDNLQNKANYLAHENEMSKLRLEALYAELRDMKMMAMDMHGNHKCGNRDEVVEYLAAYDLREKAGFRDQIEAALRKKHAENLERRKAAEAAAADNEDDDEMDHDGSQDMPDGSHIMSRRTSTQSYQSIIQQPHSDRHDSGVSNMSTPEYHLTSKHERKQSLDEGVDLGGNQLQYGQVMGNPRIAGTNFEPATAQWAVHGLPARVSTPIDAHTFFAFTNQPVH